MSDKQWNVEARVDRVKEIATRIYKDVKGESVRETMHALALATAAVIRTNFREGRGQDTALEQHVHNVYHHARKN